MKWKNVRIYKKDDKRKLAFGETQNSEPLLSEKEKIRRKTFKRTINSLIFK